MNRKDLNSIKYMLLIFMIVGLHQLYLVIKDLEKINPTTELSEDKTDAIESHDELSNNLVKESSVQVNEGRAPSSIPNPKQEPKERKIISKIKGNFANSVSKDWEEKLYTKLKHGQSVSTLIDIEHLEGLIEDREGKNFLMEHVIVKTTLPNGNHYSYHAMVNSESGEIVSTWNYQKSEHDETTLKAKAFRR